MMVPPAKIQLFKMLVPRLASSLVAIFSLLVVVIAMLVAPLWICDKGSQENPQRGIISAGVVSDKSPISDEQGIITKAHFSHEDKYSCHVRYFPKHGKTALICWTKEGNIAVTKFW